MNQREATHFFPGTTQTVAYTGTSAATTNAVDAQTKTIRVVTTTDAFMTMATTPTATTSHTFIPAYTPEYFTINPGQKVAFIQSVASGSAYVTEMTQ